MFLEKCLQNWTDLKFLLYSLSQPDVSWYMMPALQLQITFSPSLSMPHVPPVSLHSGNFISQNASLTEKKGYRNF